MMEEMVDYLVPLYILIMGGNLIMEGGLFGKTSTVDIMQLFLKKNL